MPSVAGQIRIDVLGNIGQFKGAMREAGQSLGGFTEEYDRHVRKLSQRKLGEGAQRETQAARDFLRGPEGLGFWRDRWLSGARSTGQQFAFDPMTAGQGHASLLRTMGRDLAMGPFGMSTQTTLSREAAATAAAIGAGTKKIAGSLRAAHGELASIVGEIGGAAGFGGLGRFFTTPAGMATAGIAILVQRRCPTRWSGAAGLRRSGSCRWRLPPASAMPANSLMPGSRCNRCSVSKRRFTGPRPCSPGHSVRWGSTEWQWRDSPSTS